MVWFYYHRTTIQKSSYTCQDYSQQRIVKVWGMITLTRIYIIYSIIFQTTWNRMVQIYTCPIPPHTISRISLRFVIISALSVLYTRKVCCIWHTECLQKISPKQNWNKLSFRPSGNEFSLSDFTHIKITTLIHIYLHSCFFFYNQF